MKQMAEKRLEKSMTTAFKNSVTVTKAQIDKMELGNASPIKSIVLSKQNSKEFSAKRSIDGSQYELYDEFDSNSKSNSNENMMNTCTSKTLSDGE